MKYSSLGHYRQLLKRGPVSLCYLGLPFRAQRQWDAYGHTLSAPLFLNSDHSGFFRIFHQLQIITSPNQSFLNHSGFFTSVNLTRQPEFSPANTRPSLRASQVVSLADQWSSPLRVVKSQVSVSAQVPQTWCLVPLRVKQAFSFSTFPWSSMGNWEQRRECAPFSQYSHKKDYKLDADFLQGCTDVAPSEGIFQDGGPNYGVAKTAARILFQNFNWNCLQNSGWCGQPA